MTDPITELRITRRLRRQALLMEKVHGSLVFNKPRVPDVESVGTIIRWHDNSLLSQSRPIGHISELGLTFLDVEAHAARERHLEEGIQREYVIDIDFDELT